MGLGDAHGGIGQFAGVQNSWPKLPLQQKLCVDDQGAGEADQNPLCFVYIPAFWDKWRCSAKERGPCLILDQGDFGSPEPTKRKSRASDSEECKHGGRRGECRRISFADLDRNSRNAIGWCQPNLCSCMVENFGLVSVCVRVCQQLESGRSDQLLA